MNMAGYTIILGIFWVLISIIEIGIAIKVSIAR